MQVEKYKKMRDGKYKVFFSNGKEMLLYEDVILKYELLLKKEIDTKKILNIISYNQECDVYYKALFYIKNRLRSYKEVKDYLKKYEFPLEMIDCSLERLQKQGYINDRQYASSFLHEQLITTSRGPNKIAYELEKKGIDREIIDETLACYTKEEELMKLQKIITKMIRGNKNKSRFALQKKIEQHLLQQGFHKENIDAMLQTISLPSDQKLYQKEYDKYYQKLQKKYSGEELEYQVKRKLYQRGFRYED